MDVSRLAAMCCILCAFIKQEKVTKSHQQERVVKNLYNTNLT